MIRWIACLALLACLLFAGTATAAGGGLVLLPDWLGKLPVLIVLFALLVYPVNAILFKPILEVLDSREERTTGTRSRAEKIMADADETLAKYERAVREVRAEAERQIERARGELEQALAQSRAALRTDAQSLADEAASRVLGRAL